MKALSVLVVEDDSIVGMLLGELLELMGYDVCGIEATEAGAVAAAVRCSPDLMIVDVQLSNGSGISAVEEILRTGPVSYMFVSGDISSVQALRPGAVIIRKPYREHDLAQAIQRAIGAGAVRTFVGNLAVPRGRTCPSDQSPPRSRTRLSRRRTS
jgi:two-component system, response regulator PdtaR